MNEPEQPLDARVADVIQNRDSQTRKQLEEICGPKTITKIDKRGLGYMLGDTIQNVLAWVPIVGVVVYMGMCFKYDNAYIPAEIITDQFNGGKNKQIALAEARASYKASVLKGAAWTPASEEDFAAKIGTVVDPQAKVIRVEDVSWARLRDYLIPKKQ